MSERPTRQADEGTEFSGKRVHVNGTVLVGRAATIVPATETQSKEFTRESFEGALDKVSRDEADAADALAAMEEKGEVTWEEVKRKHGL